MRQTAKTRLIGMTLGVALLGACAAPSPNAPTPTVRSASNVAPAPTLSARATPATTQTPSGQTATAPATTPTPSGQTATAPTQPTSPTARIEQPAPAETSPAGDIPDTQTFVSFKSADGGYSLDVPEGWARSVTGKDVRFVNKIDGVQVTLGATTTAPTASTASTNEVAALTKSGRAVQVTKVQDVQLPGGPAVFFEFSSNSEPDAVTGKQVRLENYGYLFFHNGKLATLTLWAPLGADNVDQWQRMAESFRWQ